MPLKSPQLKRGFDYRDMPTGIYKRTPEMKTGKYKRTPEMKTGKYKRTPEMKTGRYLRTPTMKTGKYVRVPEMKTGKYKRTPKMETGKWKRTKEFRKKMQQIYHPPSRKGSRHSEKTKRKMRESVFVYVKKVSDIICPRVGIHEKEILDKIEKALRYKIRRQYKCLGYYIDGYIPELKIAIEVDERPKILEKDIRREKIIKKALTCKFLRIMDYD